MTNSRSLQKLSRNFVIPPGSQVVLKTTKPVESPPNLVGKAPSKNNAFKKPGSVGVVLQSPPHNDLAYLIQFTDGSTVQATFDEIALRRQEINALLAKDDHDYLQHVVYRCQVGSKAFGLSTEDSDDDVRGIFLPPAQKHWSLFEIPEQIELQDGEQDDVYWELEKFIRLALKANPNILETLWTPIVMDCDPIGMELREIRTAFLSKHLYKTYSGYVLSQFRRMKNAFEKTGKYKTKHAMHLLRLLHSGIGALRTAEIMIDVSEFRDELMKVRNGELDFEEVRQKALELDQTFQAAFEKTKLPEQPDITVVNDFLIRARKSAL